MAKPPLPDALEREMRELACFLVMSDTLELVRQNLVPFFARLAAADQQLEIAESHVELWRRRSKHSEVYVDEWLQQSRSDLSRIRAALSAARAGTKGGRET